MNNNYWLIQNKTNIPYYLNMLIDEYFFYLAKKNILTSPVLRLYTWSTPSITIGYHQKISDFDINSLLNDDIKLIRRPTGGRAVFHFNDITYSIIIPQMQYSRGDYYKIINIALYLGLKNLGIKTEFEDKGLSPKERKNLPKTCFSSSNKWELKRNNKKIAGSAQNVYRNTLLQQGSIPITQDHTKIFKYLNENEEKKRKLENFYQKHTSYILENIKTPIPEKQILNSLENSFKEVFKIENIVYFSENDIF